MITYEDDALYLHTMSHLERQTQSWLPQTNVARPTAILITGAAGFIGAHLARALRFIGYRNVVLVDDLSGGFAHNVQSEMMLHVIDCADHAAMQNVIERIPKDAYKILVHCAANAREGASQFQPMSVTHRNLSAYVNTLTACIQAQFDRVVLFSSMSVYGNGGFEPPFDEQMPLQPEDVYAYNKYAMEGITRVLCDVHALEYIIIRPHNVIGEMQALCDKFRNVVGIFMNRIMRNEPLFIYGDGLQTRAFSYIGDSLPAFLQPIIVQSLCDTHLHGRAINIGGIQQITIRQLARSVFAAMRVDEDYPIEFFTDRPREVKHAFCTADLSIELLDYQEHYGWERGVQRMADWALSNGPQAWFTTDELEIVSDRVPKPWLTVK